MKPTLIIVAMASALSLAACHSQEAQTVENAYDNQADMLDNQADQLQEASDNMTGLPAANAANAAEKLEDKADALRNVGDAKADAIDHPN